MTTIAPTPFRALEQRRAALAKGNEIRSLRAQLKHDLKSQRITLLDVLETPPDWLDTAKVFDILLAAPKVGRVKASKALNRAGVSPSKTIGGMTDRQRHDLLDLLGSR